MLVNLSSKDLKDGINKVLSVIDRKINRPSLSNCLIKVENKELTLMATDLEVSVKVVIPAKISENGTFCINAKSISDVVRELPDDELNLAFDKAGGTLKITCRDYINYSLLISSAEEYPSLNFKSNVNAFSISSKEMLNAIKKVEHAISSDTTRPFLNGIFFQTTDSNLRAVAVDGYRMAILDLENFKSTNVPLTNGIIIPKKGISEIKKMAESFPNDELNLSLSDSFIYVNAGGTYFLNIRLIARDFPKYQAHIPTKTSNSMTVSRNDLLDAVKRAKVLANEKTHGIKLSFAQNKLTISASNTEYGDAVETVPVQYSGQEISIGFNANFIMDVLSVLPQSEVSFEFNNELSPSVVRSSELKQFTGILMPLKI